MIFFEFISNLHVQRYKFGRKLDKFGKNLLEKFYSAEFMDFVFSKSALNRTYTAYYAKLS